MNHKLARDLWSMRGQVFAIVLVIAGGVATFIMSLSTLDALQRTQADFYRDYRFAHVFASMVRAPERIADRLREIPGVDTVETRVVAEAVLDVPGVTLPIMSRIVSVPDTGPPALNRLFLRSGRAPARQDEVVISESFAEAHELNPGDHLAAVIKGRKKTLRITGIGLAPDFVFQLGGGSAVPDPDAFGLLWMARTPLAAAYDLEGAFNDVSVTLNPAARAPEVIGRMDEILAPYGGGGGYERADQFSHRYLSEEFKQLQRIAGLLPVIFLGVASFLLNIVITRLIGTEREEIATLKAFGYANVAVGAHYVKFVLVIVALGTAAGLGIGMWMGRIMSNQYMDYYHFPALLHRLPPTMALIAFLITAAAAVAGTLRAVARAVSQPPAQGMRPEPPAVYRRTPLERIGVDKYLTQVSRMIVRDLQRRPLKSLTTVFGIALAVGILILGTFFLDAIDHIAESEYGVVHRENLAVSFFGPTSSRALYESVSLPGVREGEPFRTVPVRLRNGHKTYRTQIEGMQGGARLRRIFNAEMQPVSPPGAGLLMTDYLADLLGLQVGDSVTVEVLETSRRITRVPVAGLVSQNIGVGAYMRLDALNRLLGEGHAISGVYLSTAAGQAEAARMALKEQPRVAGVQDLDKAVANFYETMGRQISIFIIFAGSFAAAIAFGIIYNSARIALAERGRELASLRVLGLTRGEISYILLGELGIMVLLGIPLGLLVGWLLSFYLNSAFQTDLFRFPLIIENHTYARAALLVFVSAVLSSLIVRRRLDQLDLIGVLKTRE